MLGGSLLVGRYRCYVLNPADEVRAPSTRRFFVLKIQEEKHEAEVAMVDHDITCSIYNLLVSVEVESTQIEFRTESGVVAAPPGMQAIGFLSLDRFGSPGLEEIFTLPERICLLPYGYITRRG